MPMQQLDPADFRNRLRDALHGPLPGAETQLRMAPRGRTLPFEGLEHLAAVLIALYREGGRWKFPLIHRVEDGYVHGGQVGLPGGHKEDGERPEQTALREAHEEIGLDPARVTPLGRLSRLPIPVSKTKVQVIVGLVEGVPELTPDPKEVQSILTVELADLLDPANLAHEPWTLRGQQFEIPFFRLAGHKVWGATAMILSELKQVLEGVVG